MKINKLEEQGGKVVREMIDRMIERKGVEPENREAERERIEGILDERVLDEILNALPLETLKEIDAKLDNEDFDDEEIMKMARESGIKLESVAEKVMNEFKVEYLGVEDDEIEEEM